MRMQNREGFEVSVYANAVMEKRRDLNYEAYIISR